MKQASAYFEEYGKRMAPADRHEYCVNMIKRAAELGIEVSDEARKYGSETYAPVHEFKAAYDLRRQNISGVALELMEGLYEARKELPPEVFCEVLSNIDKIAMVEHLYDKAIHDPYASTYGFHKKAEEEDSWIDGNDYVTRRQMTNLSMTGFASMAASYGDDFAKEFKKDPWGVFNSLPLIQKRRLARMAGDNSPKSGSQNVA